MMDKQQWWRSHPLDSWGQMFLLEIAHSAEPLDEKPGAMGDVVLLAKDGWEVCFAYDGGALDYIDHFITPDDKKLEVFPKGYISEEWPPIMNWRRTSDTERFRKLLQDRLGEE